MGACYNKKPYNYVIKFAIRWRLLPKRLNICCPNPKLMFSVTSSSSIALFPTICLLLWWCWLISELPKVDSYLYLSSTLSYHGSINFSALTSGTQLRNNENNWRIKISILNSHFTPQWFQIGCSSSKLWIYSHRLLSLSLIS